MRDYCTDCAAHQGNWAALQSDVSAKKRCRGAFHHNAAPALLAT